MEEENNKLEDKRKYFTAAPLKEGLVQRPCSSQLPPERPAAAKTCRQTALQQPTAARETCNSKDPAPLPTFRKTSSAPHRVHLVAVPVHPVPPSQQIRSSRHRPPRTLSSLLDLPILTSPDPANHLDLPILTSPHPANHLFDLQPIGRPPSLFSPSPNLPSSLPTPNHHDHLFYPNHRSPNQQERPMARLPYPSHLNYRCCCLEDTGSQRTRESKTSYAQINFAIPKYFVLV